MPAVGRFPRHRQQDKMGQKNDNPAGAHSRQLWQLGFVMTAHWFSRIWNRKSRATAPASGLIHLNQAPCGSRVRICELCGTAQSCQKLREMGLCENAEVQVVNRGGAIVCQVFGCRIGLSHSLANSVLVSRSH